LSLEEWVRRPAPPRHPLWGGLYSFAWRAANVKVMISLVVTLTLLALFLCGLHALIAMLLGISPDAEWGLGGSMVSAGSRFVFTALCVLSVLVSIYPASFFFHALEATAAGSDDVRWEFDAWYECFGKLLFLLWLSACSGGLAAAVAWGIDMVTPLPRLTWWCLFLPVALFFFPITLLSTLAANTPWMVLNFPIMLQLLRKPVVALMLFIDTALFALPCLLLGTWTIMGLQPLLAPLAGIVWATYWLTYARLLGRIGLVLSQDDAHGARRKKRRKG
jgi:hypothetical protein